MNSRLLSIAIALVCAVPAQADLLLDLRFDDASIAKTVSSGDTVLIDLYVTDTDGSHPDLPDGLVSGGGRLLQSAGAAALASTGTVANPAFDGTVVFPQPGGPGNEVGSVLATTGIFSFPVGFLTSSIQIAQFSFTVTGNAGDSATIDAAILGGGIIGNSTDFPSALDLDPLFTGFGAVNVNIAAVPEPSTLIVGMGLFSVLGLRRRRRSVNLSA